jgi:RimJ/RimL family protein N-acetyltransferase
MRLVSEMELYTEDLMLRTVTDDDVSEVARMWEFEKGCISREEAQNAIKRMQDNHKRNHQGYIYHLCFAVFEKGKNSIIGWCGLDGTSSADKLWIFYSIDKGYRNRRYATQCASKLLAYAFNDVGVLYVNGGCDKDNAASFNVMRKIGMSLVVYENNGDPLFYIDKKSYCNRQGSIVTLAPGDTAWN